MHPVLAREQAREGKRRTSTHHAGDKDCTARDRSTRVCAGAAGGAGSAPAAAGGAAPRLPVILTHALHCSRMGGLGGCGAQRGGGGWLPAPRAAAFLQNK